MQTCIDYDTLIYFFQKHYDKEHEGYTTLFELFKMPIKEKDEDGYVYEYNRMYGYLTIKKNLKGEFNSIPYAFPLEDRIYKSSEELSEILTKSLDETFASENLEVKSVYPDDKHLVVELKRVEAKKYMKARNEEV